MAEGEPEVAGRIAEGNLIEPGANLDLDRLPPILAVSRRLKPAANRRIKSRQLE